MRNVIKRDRIRLDGKGAPKTPRPSEPARVRQEPGVRLVQLEGGTYAVEHTCKCGEVALFEIEFEPPAEEA